MNKTNRYRSRIHKSLFEPEDARSALSGLGNPLPAAMAVGWPPAKNSCALHVNSY